jgi:hypothetical protein
MATAALRAMSDPKRAMSDWLKSQNGKYVVGAQAVSHKATVGAHSSNCRVESTHGCYDFFLRRCIGVSVERASCMAQQMRHGAGGGDFACPSQVPHDRKIGQKPPEERHIGRFHAHTEQMRQALVETGRRQFAQSRQEAWDDRKAQQKYKQFKYEQVSMPLAPPSLYKHVHAVCTFSCAPGRSYTH